MHQNASILEVTIAYLFMVKLILKDVLSVPQGLKFIWNNIEDKMITWTLSCTGVVSNQNT